MSEIIASSPHFLVRDVVSAGQYYEEKLGFSVPEYWGDPPAFAMPHRDRFIVMLNQVDRLQPAPNGNESIWDAYFWCTGVDALFAEFETAGALIEHGPENRAGYGMREIGVRNLDGYFLVFAEDIE